MRVHSAFNSPNHQKFKHDIFLIIHQCNKTYSGYTAASIGLADYNQSRIGCIGLADNNQSWIDFIGMAGNNQSRIGFTGLADGGVS